MRSVRFPDYPSLADQPDGLKTIVQRTYYSEGLFGYLTEFEGSLTFTGDTYNTFRQLLFSGQCNLVSIIMTDAQGIDYECNIFLNDSKWYPLKRAVECQVVPKGYLTNIDNNSAIGIFLNVPKSKNGSTITANIATGLTYVRPDNTAWVNDRVGVWLIDALKTLVSFMTNGEITVVSDYFENAANQPVLIKGSELRLGGGAANPEDGSYFPQISFNDLMGDVYKMFCVIFSSVEGQNVLRIEPKGYFNQTPSGFVIDGPNADSITQESDENSFFARMMFGGDFSTDYTFLPQLRFLGFDEEEYFVGIECNNKGELDLRPRNVIVDTNIIQAVIEAGATSSGDDDYDEDIFMIYHVRATSAPVLSINPVVPTDVYYNADLSNSAIALRWFGQVPYNVFAFFGFGQNEARQWRQLEYLPAYSIVGGDAAGLLNFPNIGPPLGYDPNNNMSDIAGTYEIQNTGVFVTDTVTFYTAPVSAVYTTHIDLVWQGDASEFGGCFIMKYDAADNFLNIYAIGQSEELFQGVHRVTGSAVLDAQATDKFCVMIIGSVLLPIGFNTSYSMFFQVDDPFSISQTYDERQAYTLKTLIEMPIDNQSWQTFNQNPHGQVSVNTQDGVILGHVNEAKRNSTTQQATIEIRSKLSESNI